MPRSKGRTGRPWRRVRAQVLAEARGRCEVCGITGPRPDCHHCNGSGFKPTGRACLRCTITVDHITRLADGGHPLDRRNLRAAHHSPCNTGRPRMLETSGRRRSRAW